ncbi:hypothetical protein Leryth_014931 [Lithospermum erythrorhizon]|nr:hypothetical protein Leryth_014931 [Lithospermum erythrorhizon]
MFYFMLSCPIGLALHVGSIRKQPPCHHRIVKEVLNVLLANMRLVFSDTSNFPVPQHARSATSKSALMHFTRVFDDIFKNIIRITPPGENVYSSYKWKSLVPMLVIYKASLRIFSAFLLPRVRTTILDVRGSSPVPAEAKQTPASDMKSVGRRPLENLPVGLPPIKSLPYGRKLLFTAVLISLLLPASTEESPKTMIDET